MIHGLHFLEIYAYAKNNDVDFPVNDTSGESRRPDQFAMGRRIGLSPHKHAVAGSNPAFGSSAKVAQW